MPKQNITIERTKQQNDILNLEERYFNRIVTILSSEQFNISLSEIEKEIKVYHDKYERIWKKTNKFNVAAERLIRHYLYISLRDEIEEVYPCPCSPDFGVVLKDCVLCVDIKTINTVTNENDINYTSVEKNQTSFENKSYKYITTEANIDPIDHFSESPVLTFIIKIIYSDDGNSFKISRDEHPTVIVTCIPNGKLSDLFDNNIITNFKTYSYKDYIELPLNLEKEELESYADEISSKKGFYKETIKISSRSKTLYFDLPNRNVWTVTTVDHKPYLAAINTGENTRFDNEILKNRFNSENQSWLGYKEIFIKKLAAY